MIMSSDRWLVADRPRRYGRQAMVFSVEAAAGASSYLEQRAAQTGRVVGLLISFPPGPAGVLTLRPAIVNEQGIVRDLLRWAGANALAEDDRVFNIKLDEPVAEEECVRVYYTNSGTLPHRFTVLVEIEY